MSTTLYYASGACSFVPHCLLEASGAAYEPMMIKLHKGEQKSAEYLAMNPHGQVPVLVQDGTVVTQIVAICNYINDVFPEQHFLPVAPLAKAKSLETLAWMNNSAHPSFTHFFMPAKFTDDEAAQAAVKSYNAVQFGKQLLEIQAMVTGLSANTPWLSGTHFGPLDAYALTLMRWGGYAGIDPTTMPSLWEHSQKVAQLPALARVIERERLQLNVYTAPK